MCQHRTTNTNMGLSVRGKGLVKITKPKPLTLTPTNKVSKKWQKKKSRDW